MRTGELKSFIDIIESLFGVCEISFIRNTFEFRALGSTSICATLNYQNAWVDLKQSRKNIEEPKVQKARDAFTERFGILDEEENDEYNGKV